MNRMLAELTRWNRPPGRGHVVDRWTAWAASLGAGRGRIQFSGGRPAMTLADPRGMALRSERWFRLALTLMPRIELTVNRLFWSATPSSRPARLTLAGEDRRSPFMSEPVVAAPELRVLQPGTDRVSDVDKGTASPQPRPPLALAPVEQVFARLVSPDPIAGRTEPTQLPAAARMSREVLTRVVDERRRVEEQVRRTLVDERPAQPMPAIAEENFSARSGREIRGYFSGQPGAASWNGGQPVIDIEQVTEQVVRQIDHRVTALRERLGGLS
jgi:hypothetical protein